MATSPFVISGLKAAQPGGLGNTISNTNTLKPAFTAPASQQKALGQPGNAAIASLLMGPQAPAAQPATRNVPPAQNMFTAPSTPLKSTTTSGDGSTVQTYHAPIVPQQPVTTQSVKNADGTYTLSAPGTSDTSAQSQTPSVGASMQPPSFPGTIGSLIQSAQQGSPQATQATTGLLDANGQNSPLVGEQKNTAQDIQNLRTTLATDTGALYNQGGELNYQTGRIGALQNQEAEKETAANAKLSALAAIQSTQNTGLNEAGGVANQSRSLQQSGFTSAAGLQQPSASYPFVFNPTTSTFTNAGGGVLSAQDAAQAVMSGKISYDQAKSSLGYLGGTGEAQLQQAITSAGGNPLALQAQGSAQQSNVQTAGTAGTQANQAVFNKAYGDYTTLQNAVQNVDQFGQLLTQNMGGINPSDVRYANQTIAQIRSQLSSGQQAQFNSTLAALTSKVSGLLSVGGNEIPTDISTAANKIIDGSLPVGSLTAVLSRIQQEGNILLQNQAGIVNNAYAGIQGGNNTQTQNGNTNSTSLYSF